MTEPSTTTFVPPLRLEPLAGPAVDVPMLDPRREFLLGRGVDSDIGLLHESVSRQHARIARRGGRWLVTDANSRCGTLLNGRALVPGTPTKLLDGDLLGIGPWTFRATLGDHTASRTSTIADFGSGKQRVERLEIGHTTHPAQRQLNLIIDCAGAIAAASNMKEIGEAVLEAALGGVDFDRAAVLTQGSAFDEVEVVALKSRGSGGNFAFSRSLLEAAASGQMARLTDLQSQLDVPIGASIVTLGITAALCVPVMLGNSVAAYLYLDSRAHRPSESSGEASNLPTAESPAAAGFCQAIGRLYGLALANLKRADLEQRQRRLEDEVHAAREVQLLLLPAERGDAGPVRYAMCSRPGQFVAGDLFDVVEIDADRTVVVIGDVVGHGFGPAVLMAAAQSHLNTLLRRDADPAAAVSSLNRDLAGRDGAGRFITLWVGVFDRVSGMLTAVDAGHGYVIRLSAGGVPTQLKMGAGIPVGVDADYVYRAETMPLGEGDRVLLFSDGLVEERCAADGSPVGVETIVEAMTTATDAASTVAAVIDAVERATEGAPFTDDTTVACVEWR
ncbi:MAG: SpoIIE family protein phosphatase [Phycisphaerales bacterium]|nr:SpoIIE family protein phosphatase [Phycisphaerales bacterium]